MRRDLKDLLAALRKKYHLFVVEFSAEAICTDCQEASEIAANPEP